MTPKFQRPLSILLAVMMIVGVFAAFPVTADATVKKSGSTLTLSGTVTLAELTGTGSIKATEKRNITKITAAKNTKFTGSSTASMFTSFPNCTSIDLTNVTFSSWVNASSMFSGLSKLTDLKLSKLNITNADSMFKGCSSLTGIDVSALNARSYSFTSMANMFSGCTKLRSIDFGSSFFTGYATSMSNMFKDCSSLETLDISTFDTNRCGAMNYMFGGCESLKTLTFGDDFKTDSCTEINHMFAGCSSLESLDVSSFNTQSAQTMQGMFDGCSSLTSLDVSGFNTSSVWNLADMFNGCSSLTSLDVSGFDTSNVTLFSGMFDGCSGLASLDLSSFKANNPDYDNDVYKDLFSGCTALDRVKLSDQFSISEAMKLTNAKDDYTGWANEENPDTIISGDGEYAVFSGAGSYVRSSTPVIKPIFVGHSLSLGGDIGVNFYLNLTQEEAQNAAISFTWFDKALNDAPITLDPCGSGWYKASCPVAVAEMTYDVTATLIVGDQTYTDTYSPVTYANVILNDESFKTKYIDKTSEEKYNQLVTLVQTMLDYGAKAQVRFDRNTDYPANGGTDFFTDEVTFTSGASNMDEYLSDCGLTYVGTSVVYLTETTLRHYYKITDVSKFTDEIKNGITFDGESVTYGERGSMIYFDKKNIAASQLDTEYALSINGHEYHYSALDYSALSYSSDDKLYSESITKQLAASVYRYNQAANAFFND